MLDTYPSLPSVKKGSKEKAILVTMHLENLSSVPAAVFYAQLTTWIDGTAGPWMHSPSRDVLYEHKEGFSELPLITGDVAKKLIDGQSELMIGICVVYSSISPSDSRRWEARALYSYESGSDFQVIQYSRETEVSASENSCNSGNLRLEWSEQRIPVKHSTPTK
jgi:hypothetical protein